MSRIDGDEKDDGRHAYRDNVDDRYQPRSDTVKEVTGYWPNLKDS